MKKLHDEVPRMKMGQFLNYALPRNIGNLSVAVSSCVDGCVDCSVSSCALKNLPPKALIEANM